MRKSYLIIIALSLFSLISCTDYIASKRNGLKPYKHDSYDKQAQERQDPTHYNDE
jgi:hypothetical protein